MQIVGRGHPFVRATHDKTLELTPDADITERATCVVAVGAGSGLPRALAGAVRLRLTVGSLSHTLTARANPGWDPAGTAVIRRSAVRAPGTFATHADGSAADLARELVAALGDPSAEVVLDVERVPGPPCAVLALLDPAGPPDPRLAAEIAATDLLVVEDDTAARLLGERVSHGPVPVEGRVLVVACEDLPGRSVAESLGRVQLETVGMPPVLAAAAVSPSRGAILLVPGGADPRAALRAATVGTRVVVRTTSDRVADLTRLAAELRGTAGAVVTATDRPPVRIGAGVTLPGRGTVHVCLDLADSAGLDPVVRGAIDALLQDGVPTRTAAKVLATLAGWERRRAYAAILDWPGRPV